MTWNIDIVSYLNSMCSFFSVTLVDGSNSSVQSIGLTNTTSLSLSSVLGVSIFGSQTGENTFALPLVMLRIPTLFLTMIYPLLFAGVNAFAHLILSLALYLFHPCFPPSCFYFFYGFILCSQSVSETFSVCVRNPIYSMLEECHHGSKSCSRSTTRRALR